MCKYHRKFNDFLAELREQRALLNKEMSRLDRKVSNLYHDLEGIEPNAEFALSFVVQLHDTLRKRRVVKDEVARLDNILRPVSKVSEEIEESVSKRKVVSRRWRRDFKMKMTIEQVLKLERIMIEG